MFDVPDETNYTKLPTGVKCSCWKPIKADEKYEKVEHWHHRFKFKGTVRYNYRLSKTGQFKKILDVQTSDFESQANDKSHTRADWIVEEER